MHNPLLAAAALLLATTSTAALADTLVRNANGIQVRGDGKLERFTGILMGDDGKVKRLLHGEMLKLGGDTKVVDAGGRTLLPGLIDAHGHVMALGFGALQLDLTGTTSIADLQQRLKAYAAANPGSGWIIGRGWNQENWPGKRFPTSADLDAVVSDRPVWLERVDGHASVGNSAALRAAGITAATRAPAGGRIENGLFVDAATELVSSKIPAPTRAAFDAALAKAQELMLSTGLTAAADMGTSAEDWAAMNRAGRAGRLNVRIMSYAGGIPSMRAINGGKPTGWLFGDRLHLGGVKLYADGALGSRGAWLKAPYHDMPSTRGLSLISDAELRRQTMLAAANGHQLAVHAIGDAANAQVIAATVATAAGGSNMPRCSMSPTCRDWHGRASSPRCSRPTRPATEPWPKHASARSGSAAPTRGARSSGRARGSPSDLTSRSNRPTPSPASPPRSAARIRRASPRAGGVRRSASALSML